jgi:hypothetical protein
MKKKSIFSIIIFVIKNICAIKYANKREYVRSILKEKIELGKTNSENSLTFISNLWLK